MRISTSQIHQRGVDAMLDQQAKLSKTSVQLSTGRRILSPSDDPSGSARILDLDKSIETTTQYNRNADAAESRLNLEETTLAGMTEVLDRTRELTLQANNATQTDESRASIAMELRQLEEELLALANTQDANGEYLFAGNKTDTQPFVRNADGSVSYNGDQGQRFLQIGEGNQIPIGDAGMDVFMGIPEGNGTFVVDAGVANGSGVVDEGSVTDSASLTGHDYTLQFGTDSNGELRYLVNDDTNTPAFDWSTVDWDLQGTAFASGQSIEFDGMEFAITGGPVAGDTFTVRPSGNASLFTTLHDLVATLESPTYSDSDSARLHNDINHALANLDQAGQTVNVTRAKVGGRLNTIDRQHYTNDDYILQLQSVRSEVADLDYAEATARYSQEETGLQAAQQAYIKIKELSLFDYL